MHLNRRVILLFSSLLAAGCSTSGVSIPHLPAVAPLHLYVGNDNTPGVVLQYNLPLSASSTPNFSIVSNNVVSVATDASGNLVVGDYAGHLQFFAAPLSGTSTPAATFNNGAATNDGQIAFTSTSDFWAGTVSNRGNGFTQPFSNGSVPSAFVTNGALVAAIGMAFDSAQNLYISNASSNSNLLVYAPPYTAAPIITPTVTGTAYRKIALSATQLFVASVSSPPGRVDVYNLPITSTSAPVAFSLTSGVSTPEGLAVDPSGNLYVGNLNNATVTVYSPPIIAGSAPSVTLTVSAGAFAIFGISVGK